MSETPADPTKTIEFHFDFGSPNAYFSHLVLPQIAQRTGATVKPVPVQLLMFTSPLISQLPPFETLPLILVMLSEPPNTDTLLGLSVFSKSKTFSKLEM